MKTENLARSGDAGRAVPIVLTATINNRGVVDMARSDARIRMLDYKSALEKWLSNKSVRSIVVCENSASDLTELREVVNRCNHHGTEVEFLSFGGQHFPPELGKGYGEMLTLAYVANHSQLVKKAGRFLKVNGRYYIRNIARILASREIVEADILCNFNCNLSYSDSRVFVSSLAFFFNYLLPLHNDLDDSRGVFLEHLLARAAHRALGDCLRWSLLPVAPEIVGISGTFGTKYPSNPLWFLARQIKFSLKRKLLA
jgi:hypothetical protein